MANPAKAKGTAWETAVVRFLREAGLDTARRNAQHGAKDVGDIGGVPHFAIEAKDHATLAFSEWLDQAEAEAANAGEDFGVVVAKRRRRPVGDAYVVMTLETFTRLVQALLGAEAEVEALSAWSLPTGGQDGERDWVYVDEVEARLRRTLPPRRS